MQTNSAEHYPQEDEIDLKQLLQSLAKQKKFIFGLTAIITVIAIVYALSIPLVYKVGTSFLSPSTASVLQLNKDGITEITNEDVYRNFVNKIVSSKFQKQVFDDNNYLARLNLEKPPANLGDFFAGFSKSIQLETNKIQKNIEKINYEKTTNISIKGNNAIVLADFLNDLANIANKEVVAELITTTQQKITLRLAQILKERDLLLEQEKQNRLASIKRIKIADAQKINEINDKINRLRDQAKLDRLNKITLLTNDNQLKIVTIKQEIATSRFKAKAQRLNKIQELTDLAKIATDLNIVDNNFTSINKDKLNSSSLAITIGAEQLVPNWYLYGKKAILKEIDILKSRTNDDPYIPELIDLNNQIIMINDDKKLADLKSRTNDDPYILNLTKLKNQLDEIKSNQTLKTLELRKDDAPFVEKISELDVESIKLKSITLKATGINAMRVNQYAYAPETPIKPNKRLIVIIGFIIGFILSIFLALARNALREQPKQIREPQIREPK